MAKVEQRVWGTGTLLMLARGSAIARIPGNAKPGNHPAPARRSEILKRRSACDAETLILRPTPRDLGGVME
jgi:hypothetical protein